MSQYQNRLNRKSKLEGRVQWGAPAHVKKKCWPGIILALMTLPLRPQQSDPPAGASGQSAAPAAPPTVLMHRSPEDRDRASRVAHHIILNVVVTDASGKPVAGLQQKDFTLFDNHQPQQIVSFHGVEGRTAKPPVHIIFMLDILNNSFQDIARQVRAVEKYLDQNREQLSFPVSIAVLTEHGINLGQPSRDGKALIGQLKKVHMPLATIGSPEGSNAGRFHLSVQSLTKLVAEQEDVPGRVLLIWMGPGWPMLSDGPYPGTPMDKRNFFAEVLNLSTGFLDAQMTMDTISSPNPMHENGRPRNYYKPFLTGVQRADQADPGNLALPVLAYQSGGKVFAVDKDLAGDIASCVADLESYYVLSFDSPHASQDIEYRALQITIDKAGLSLRTNAFYYAQP
jgi:VWFA-related protein